MESVSFFGHSHGSFPHLGQITGGVGHWQGYSLQTGHFWGGFGHWHGNFPHLGHGSDLDGPSKGSVILALKSSVSVRFGLA